MTQNQSIIIKFFYFLLLFASRSVVMLCLFPVNKPRTPASSEHPLLFLLVKQLILFFAIIEEFIILLVCSKTSHVHFYESEAIKSSATPVLILSINSNCILCIFPFDMGLVILCQFKIEDKRHQLDLYRA